ncbi:putative receptor protein kinase ZmPK1 [Bienertia sinuspersici]
MRTQIILFLLNISCFSFIISTTSKSSNFLPRSSSIDVEDSSTNHLISNDKTFICGFYTLNDTTNAYYFGIWFTNSKERTLVWIANRKKPVNGHGSRLTLRKDGALVLTDLDGSLVWQTNTSSVENHKLISKASPNILNHGYYSLFFDNDNVLKMVYDGPEYSSIYWPNPDYTIWQNGRTNYNSTRVAIFDNNGTLVSSDRLRFSASDNGFGVKRRLTMDYDGNLRLYSLNNMSRLWTITWQAVIKQCGIHGLCGRNGICVYTPQPKCSCPPYHKPYSSTNWSKGCKPKFARNCNDSQFLKLPHVDYYGFDLNYTQNTSFDACRNLCLKDCQCQAFKHVVREGVWVCYTKSDLFNGYRAEDNLYLRIPSSEQELGPKIILNVSRLSCGGGENPETLMLNKTYRDTSNQSFKWVYVYSFVGAIGAIEVIIFVTSLIFLFRKHGISASFEEWYRTISSHFRSFSYNELKSATNKFRQVLGSGGFGAVYKGVLADERVIAVKKLENIVQGEEEFWAEVSTFGRINHMNLARMWGFCSEAKHRLLVYEYVENGSLDKHYVIVDDNVGDEEEMLELRSFVKFAKEKMQNGGISWVDDLMDMRLEGKFSKNQAAKMIEIGILCVEDDRNKRPTMESVAQVLAECKDETLHNMPNNI